MKTIVLFSGGIDSTTALYWAINEGWEVSALTFDVQQASRMDIKASQTIAGICTLEDHKIIHLPFYDEFTIHSSIGSVGKDGKSVSKDYLPVRNPIFYSIATGWAETIGAHQIISGSTIEDGYDLPDARIEFYTMMNQILRYGTRSGVVGHSIKILTPLIEKKHADILRLARDLNVPLELTWSCFNDTPPACGKCRSCVSRISSFTQLGLKDPITYAETED